MHHYPTLSADTQKWFVLCTLGLEVCKQVVSDDRIEVKSVDWENNNFAEVPTLSWKANCLTRKAILIVSIQPYKCWILYKSMQVSKVSVSWISQKEVYFVKPLNPGRQLTIIGWGFSFVWSNTMLKSYLIEKSADCSKLFLICSALQNAKTAR